MEVERSECAVTALRAALCSGDTARLCALLAQARAEDVASAIATLGQDAARAAVSPLLDALIYHGDDEEAEADDRDVRINAALALGHLGDRQALEPLLQALATDDLTVRWYVIDALGLLADPRAITPLIAALAHPDIDMRKAAWRALAAIGEPAVAPLLAALAWGDAYHFAPRALAAIGNPCAIPALISVLTDRSRAGGTRYWAAVALGQLGATAAFDVLVGLLEDDSEPALLRHGVAKGLGLLRDTRAVDSLLALLDTELQRAVVTALGGIGERRVVERLITLLERDTDAADAVAQALGALGDARALPALKRVQPVFSMDGSDRWTRVAIDRAIEYLEQQAERHNA